MKALLGMVLLLRSALTTEDVENNACPTYKDYYTVKHNPNCYYDVAAEATTVWCSTLEYFKPGVIVGSGYPVEVHRVITEDGYILTLFRIPNYGVDSSVEKKGPVLIQHGWYASSANFVGHGRESLAFVLADAGYDVWLGNARGTQYSEDHVNLTVHDRQYWDYSTDELGLYDVPAMLELISERTGKRGNIVYIGHSLGTTMGLMYASTFPQNAKETVKLFILLAPVAAIPNIKSPIVRLLAPFADLFLKIVESNDLVRLLSQTKVLKTLFRGLCLESPRLLEACINLSHFFFSGLPTQTGAKSATIFTNQFAEGASVKMFGVARDWILKGRFRRYNYGINNIHRYGTVTPPEYNVTQIETPVYLVYGLSDWVATEKDTLMLYSRLSPTARSYGYYGVPAPFNHADFHFGRNVKELLFDRLLKLIHKV